MKLLGKFLCLVAALAIGWFCYDSFVQLVLDGDCTELYLPVKDHLQFCKE